MIRQHTAVSDTLQIVFACLCFYWTQTRTCRCLSPSPGSSKPPVLCFGALKHCQKWRLVSPLLTLQPWCVSFAMVWSARSLQDLLNRSGNFSLSRGPFFFFFSFFLFPPPSQINSFGLWVCRSSAWCQYCCQVWLLRLAGDCAAAQILT